MELIFMLIKLAFIQASFYVSCTAEVGLQRVFDPGDIVIAGLFPIHTARNGSASDICVLDSFNPNVLLYSQVMIYAIEQINNSSRSFKVKIGYEMYDTCSDIFAAMNATLQLLQKEALLGEGCFVPNASLVKSNVKAVIGEYTSEMSVAVARLLSLTRMTQISYGSTSEILSSKSKFPSFFRTVPSDKWQTEAIAKLVKKFNFVPVGIFGSDDEYGKYGVESLTDYFKNYSLCLEFKEILPKDFSDNPSKLAELRRILITSRAEAIVLFTDAKTAETVLTETVNLGKKRTWIGSDGRSTSDRILQMNNLSQAGRILGVTCKIKQVSGFVEYMEQIIHQNSTKASFFSNILAKSPFCSGEEENQTCTSFATKPINEAKNCISKKCLLDFLKTYKSYEPYTVYVAVKIIDQAIKSALQKNDKDFPAWKVIEEIEKDNTTDMKLSKNRDLDLGYDILELATGQLKTIGNYTKNDIFLDSDVPRENNTVTQFNCYKSCKPGSELTSQGDSCCHQCIPCTPGQFSSGGESKCELCKDSDNSQCTEEVLEWEGDFSITLAFFAAVGLVITIAVFVLFLKYYHTPVVRAAGGYLCFPALFSLLGCFTSVYLLLGKPTHASCMSAMPLFGLSFTLCVSCILANLLQIFICFSHDLKYGNLLKHINQYPIVVMVCTSVQVVVCTLWLVLSPPYKGKLTTDRIINVFNVGSQVFYFVMLVYIALLCIIGFVFAYKGKRLPDLYKNASFIKISMLFYLVVWIIICPVYITNMSKYMGAFEALAVLVSSYGILICHFGPKCYILLLNNELNDENKIVEYIRNYYESKGITAVTGKSYTELQAHHHLFLQPGSEKQAVSEEKITEHSQ